jgi:uncharacterized protein (DUF305 family)
LLIDLVGMPPPELLENLKGMEGERFARLFLLVMLRHHEGALGWVTMF